MTDSRVAPGLDRLPWLPDEPARAPKRSGLLVGWAIAATILVAAAAYWLGVHSETPHSSRFRANPRPFRSPKQLRRPQASAKFDPCRRPRSSAWSRRRFL